MNNRRRNAGMWLAMISHIAMGVQLFAMLFFDIEISDEKMKMFMAMVYELIFALVVAGILSDPKTDNKWFLDDPHKKDDDAK